MSVSLQPICTYHIDASDCLTQVDSGWGKFARDNRAPELEQSLVLGNSIWQYFSGFEITCFYRRVLKVVRSHRHAVRLPFRCDAPDVKRYHVMIIEPLKDGACRFRTCLEREEATAFHPLLDPQRANGPETWWACSWCRRVCLDNFWIEIENLPPQESGWSPPRLIETLCPSCSAMLDMAVCRAANSAA